MIKEMLGVAVTGALLASCVPGEQAPDPNSAPTSSVAPTTDASHMRKVRLDVLPSVLPSAVQVQIPNVAAVHRYTVSGGNQANGAPNVYDDASDFSAVRIGE